MLHYYGDWVRRFFFFGGLLMLVSLPLFRELVPFPVIASALLIVVLTLIAALTSPASKRITVLNVAVSAAAVILFEYYAVAALSLPNWDSTAELFFWTNHALALDFVLALYFSAKTWRGTMLEE